MTPGGVSPFSDGGFHTSMTQIAMLARVLYSCYGHPSHTGWRIEVRQSSSTISSFSLLSYFSPPLISFYSTFISPFSVKALSLTSICVLFSSICNLFALLGRKAPFTHSHALYWMRLLNQDQMLVDIVYSKGTLIYLFFSFYNLKNLIDSFWFDYRLF